MSHDSTPTGDIHGKEEIKQVVAAFYAKVREDDLLGFIGSQVVKVKWPKHEKNIMHYWDSVLFDGRKFKGNQIMTHADLLRKTPLGPKQFNRWLRLFFETVDELYAGPNAERMKASALETSNFMYPNIHKICGMEYEDVVLEPEQLPSE